MEDTIIDIVCLVYENSKQNERKLEMKVVINKCYGGFGLSNEAFELYLNKKGIEFEKITSNASLSENDYYEKGHLKSDKHMLWHGKLITNRADKDLVAVVEELGEKVNTWVSELAIVEIPDDISFEIEEYDGQEWISETHRTWS